MAQTGKKVLFIDTDMRKGYTHKLFQTKRILMAYQIFYLEK
nr:hypothetical protein [Klebsiella pneumoniae]